LQHLPNINKTSPDSYRLSDQVTYFPSNRLSDYKVDARDLFTILC